MAIAQQSTPQHNGADARTTKTPVYVMSHTHWDRAWYLPFEKFRRVLVKSFDRLIEHFTNLPEYRQFVFDGQTVVVEDYLAIRPEKREALAALVRDRRLRIGPFYMLPDEFLAGQEALVRNGLLGREISEGFGGRMDVGYVADPFGHPEQMPQILAGMGLDSIVFARGIGPEIDPARSEFIWRAADGSEVYAIWQHNWYCSGSYLGYPEIQGCDDRSIFRFEDGVKQLLDQAQDYVAKTCVGAIVIYNGIDHEVPKADVIEMIKEANRRSETFEFIHSDMLPFLEHVRASREKLQTYKGELRSGLHTGLLGGTLATRMYLKQNQETVEALLAKQAEPLAALGLALGQFPYPRAFFSYAWKEHMKNLPHDDICGCSTDETHLDAETRSRNARQVAEDVLAEAARAIAEDVDGSYQSARPFIVFNSMPFTRDIAVAHLDFRASQWDGKGSVKVIDDEGQAIPCELTSVTFEHLLGHQSERCMHRAHVQMVVPEVPGLGWKVIYAEPTTEPAGAVAAQISITGQTVETPLVTLTLHEDGSLDVLEKATGRCYRGVNGLRDVADHGDEYNFDALPGDVMIAATPHKPWRVVGQSATVAELETELLMPVPAALAADRRRRSDEIVQISLTLNMTVRAASTRLDFRVRLHNTCNDHKLLVLFPTGLQSDAVWVDNTFGLFQKPVDVPAGEEVANWHEKPLAQRPVKGFVLVEDPGQGGAVVFNKGLPEFEALREGDRSVTIAQTLFRAVGWLSRGDLHIRLQNGGPEVPAPGGQCLRDFEFAYAFMPFKGEVRKAALYQASADFAIPGYWAPLLDRESDPDPSHPAYKDRFVPRPREGRLPSVFGLIDIIEGDFAVSTVKRAEESDQLIARLYNPHDVDQTLKIRFGITPKRVEWVECDERRVVRRLEVRSDCKLAFDVPAYKIVTLRLSF